MVPGTTLSEGGQGAAEPRFDGDTIGLSRIPDQALVHLVRGFALTK